MLTDILVRFHGCMSILFQLGATQYLDNEKDVKTVYFPLWYAEMIKKICGIMWEKTNSM